MNRAFLALALALALAGCGRPPSVQKQILVLGIDAMDPGFLERHWDALPNLDRLRRTGDFRRMATTVPPQSPVAWSTFITGLDPGGPHRRHRRQQLEWHHHRSQSERL